MKKFLTQVRDGAGLEFLQPSPPPAVEKAKGKL